jgi:aspartate oxidase
VTRDREGLERLLEMLEQAPPGADGLDLAGAEATSLHTVSVLVATAALARTESRGCHRWRDVPVTSGGRASHTVLHVEDGRARVVADGQPLIAAAAPARAGADA